MYKMTNEIIRETLDHYYEHHDAESFFKLVEYHETCTQANLTTEEIPALIEMQNVIIMGQYAMAYTYILECCDGTLYTGWTNDLCNRVATHNAGKGAKYTRSRLPVKLVYCHQYATKQEAMSEEYRIKRLSRPDKIRLISSSMNQLQE